MGGRNVHPSTEAPPGDHQLEVGRRRVTLAERIAQELAGTGRPQTCEEIARALRVRTIDVRRVLNEDPRFVRTTPGPRSPKAKLFVAVDIPDRQDGSGRVGDETTERSAA